MHHTKHYQDFKKTIHAASEDMSNKRFIFQASLRAFPELFSTKHRQAVRLQLLMMVYTQHSYCNMRQIYFPVLRQ